MISQLINQTLIILLLFITGMALVRIIGNSISFYKSAIISFPMGLALYSIIGLLLLILCIPYNRVSVTATYIIVFGVLVFLKIRKCGFKSSNKSAYYLAFVIIACLIALLSVSGLIPVSISNDSIYYYSVYPQTIAIDGGYALSYDVFLTDVGQSVAIINTLPFFFGFNETFGIQIAMMISFTIFFITFAYERMNNKWATLILGLFLVSTTPYLVISEWILANAYFMAFSFLIFAISAIYVKDKQKEWLWVIAILIVSTSMMRMEAGLFLGLLILVISTFDINKNELIKYFLMPSVMAIIPYYLLLYIKFRVDPLYSFLDIKKALLQIGFILVVAVYIGLFRDERKFISKNLDAFLISGLLAVNGMLLLYNHEKFLTNITAFSTNIVQGRGWGYFGFFVIIISLLMVGNNKMTASGLYCISFLLLCMAVLFARDGALRVGTGDSGNRVLLQIVPFVIYAIVECFTDNYLLGENNGENKE